MQTKGSLPKRDKNFFMVEAKAKDKGDKTDIQKFIIDPARDARKRK